MIEILIIGLIAILITGGYSWIVQKPHGYVEFKTGLLLKLLPEIKGEVDLIRLRKEYEKLSTSTILGRRPVMKNTELLTIPTRHGSVSTRAYKHPNGKNAPLIIFFHGGGWCIGSIDTHDEECTRLSLASEYSVLSIDYSLAPEHRFPRAVEECIDATEWVLTQSELDFARTDKVVLIGDSAGGNLSIVVAYQLILDNMKDRIAQVVPIYPVTDCYSDKGGSYKDYDNGYQLTKNLMNAFEKGYFDNKEDQKSPHASPALIDNLPIFPDTWLISAEFDPLRDEGEAFAERLKSIGTNVTVKRYDGAIHGFFGRSAYGKKGILALKELAAYLKQQNKGR